MALPQSKRSTRKRIRLTPRSQSATGINGIFPRALHHADRSVTVAVAVGRFRDAGKDEKERRRERERERERESGTRTRSARLHANANQNSRIARKGGLRREHKGVTTNKGISVKNNNFKPAFRVEAQRTRAFPRRFRPAKRDPPSSTGLH